MNTLKRFLSPKKCDNNEGQMKKQKLQIGAASSISTKEKTEAVELEDNFDAFFEEDFDFATLDAIQQEKTNGVTLDLSEWQRCVVEQMEREKRTYDLVLHVSSAADAAEQEENKAKGVDKENEVAKKTASTKCHLQGPWSHTRIEVGDVISLIGAWDEQLGAYKVNQEQGYCTYQPDTLISGTTVVGSLFCRRKAVLQDRFRGIDANNKVMLVGSLVHELLQVVLEKQLKTYNEIDAVAQQLLESQETAYTLYGSLMTSDEIALEVQKFVPNILAFVEQYVQGRESATQQKDLFQGTISQIQDIEENVWVPQLGLKGKIDVSVRIKRRQTLAESKTAIPLELKTGRASFSMEHKGQVMLYQMMLTALGRETHTGLLLYLREGIMREVRGARNEQRDLMVLRNELAHYLSYFPAIPLNSDGLSLGDGKYWQPLELPEPISHHSACETCAYATICCTFAKTNTALELSNKHPLRKVMKESTAHLKEQDYAYFIRWCGLLALEEQEARKSHYLRALWTDTPEQRQRQGRAIVDLRLHDEVIFEETRYRHTFEVAPAKEGKQGIDEEDESSLDLTLSGFSAGQYVIVSSRKRLAIAAGFIHELTSTTISISLERNLHKNYPNQAFIVDMHESQSSHVFNYTNLGILLDATERSAALRSIVIDRVEPSFVKVLPKVIAQQGAHIFKQLNAVQRSAVLKALTAQNYMLIRGLPGTGKTETLVAIVRLLQLMGKSVLITSYTHSAVDNLLLRLKPHALPMLRLGSGARIHPQLQDCAESELLKDCKTESQLTAKYASFDIVGVTCLGASHALFLHRKFDFCIVDEATQAMQVTVLRPLFFCDKFILVGDPDQLPPLIRSREGRLRGADESLFQRLDSEQATAVLTLQYRMNKTITRLANELTYLGALQCANKQLELASVKSVDVEEKWLKRALQPHIDQAVFLLDTLNCAERSLNFASTKHSNTCAAIETTFAEVSTESPKRQKSTSKRLSKYTNYCEAAIVFHIVRVLLKANYDATRIGIIAPYRAQVELLRRLAAQHQTYYQEQEGLNFGAVEVNTVDQYQGRDKDIILYSCSKTGNAVERDLERAREAEILEDKRRLTVAITRAKYKLLLIGDSACLQQYSPFRTLFTHIPSYSRLQLSDGKQDFDWTRLLEQLSQVISV